jgi:hypothetical protein
MTGLRVKQRIDRLQSLTRQREKRLGLSLPGMALLTE